MTPFRDQKFEILRERGTTQSHTGIEEVPSRRNIPAFLDSTTYSARPPPAVFEQFEHCVRVSVFCLLVICPIAIA